MSGPAEILCSRCGTPFPKEKGKAAVTCVVCGQLRPDLDLTLDDDDDDLGAALSSSSGGGASSGGSGGGFGSNGGGGGGTGAASAMDPETHVLRVAASTGPTTGIDAPSEPGRGAPRNAPFRVDQPYMAMSESRMAPAYGGSPTMSGDRLLDRIGVVLLVVCPLAVGMAGALNMLARTEDFSVGTWYAVGVVFLTMLMAAVVLGMVATGLMYLVRIRWTVLIRMAFIAATAAVGYFGMNEVPSHIQVRHDGLPGLVLRR